MINGLDALVGAINIPVSRTPHETLKMKIPENLRGKKEKKKNALC